MIRQAQQDDFGQILHIRSQVGLQRDKLSSSAYREKAQKEGFLLYPTISLEEFTEEIKNLFFVFVLDTKVEGFILIEEKRAIALDSPVIWEKPDMKEIYFTSPPAYLSGIAVDPLSTQKGVATQLLSESIRLLPKEIRYLFSIVVTSPVYNTPSVKFHEKNGFERVGSIHYARRAELDNYESIVYVKKL